MLGYVWLGLGVGWDIEDMKSLKYHIAVIQLPWSYCCNGGQLVGHSFTVLEIVQLLVTRIYTVHWQECPPCMFNKHTLADLGSISDGVCQLSS